jgi:hypothetical protein
VRQTRVQQLLQVVKEAFQNAGSPIGEGALEFAIAMAQLPRFEEVVDEPEGIAKASVAAGCLHWKRQYEAMSQKEWAEYLVKMNKELPYGLRSAFRAGMNKIVKSLPKRPSTGRDQLLNPKEQKKACNLVSQYHRNGDSLRKAYEKVAAEMNCSSRTIQRTWKRRAQILRSSDRAGIVRKST